MDVGKKYKNIVCIESEKDALILGAKEGSSYAEAYMNVQRPMRIVIQKERSYIEALLKSSQYSKMGIFNMFIQSDRLGSSYD